MNAERKQHVLAVGGGKGGVGKSFVTAGLATTLAGWGMDTMLIDLDLGAANLHTLFGIRTTDRGIGDFIYTPHSNRLADYAVDTGVTRLRLISGNGFIPGIANLTYAQKMRVLKAIGQLQADAVLLDLGAGTSYNVIDFFSITQSGILVTVSEPTAILNAYEFLKNVLFRIFHQRFKGQPQVAQLIEAFKINPGESPSIAALARAVGMVEPEAGKTMLDICGNFRPGLVVNMSRDESMNLGQNLHDICANFLSLDVDFLGAVPSDEKAQECVQRMRPVTVEYPSSPSARALRDIARRCVTGRWVEERKLALEEAPEEAADTTASALNRIMSGHKDSELSGLLGRFLAEYSTATWPGVVPPKIRPEVSASAPESPQEKTLHISPWEFFRVEPREHPLERVPMFSSTDDLDRKEKAGGWLARWRSSGSLARAVRAIPESAHLALAFETVEKMPGSRRPEMAWAWMRVGQKLLQAHQVALAARAFHRAQTCRPKDELTVSDYAAALLAEGRVRPAMELLKAGLKSAAECPPLLFNLGLAHVLLSQYQEAIPPLRQYGHMREKTPAVMMLLGCCLFHMRDYAAAHAAYEAVLDQQPGDLNALFNKALCLLCDHRVSEAEGGFSEFLGCKPDDPDASAAQALARWDMNRKTDALQDMDGVVRRHPAHLAYRGLRGTMALLSGYYDRAVEDLEIIARLQPDHQAYQKIAVDVRAYLSRKQPQG